MRDDEVMLGVHGGLHIVADHAIHTVAHHHQPGIGIGGQRHAVKLPRCLYLPLKRLLGSRFLSALHRS
jgi:hypothetical protein